MNTVGTVSDVALNRIGPEEVVKFETLKKIILRMAHESGLTQNDKCPSEWNQWPVEGHLMDARVQGE